MKFKTDKMQVELIYVTYSNYGERFLSIIKIVSKFFGVSISITQVENGNHSRRISASDKYQVHNNELWEFGAWKNEFCNTTADYVILANDTIGVRQPKWVPLLVFLFRISKASPATELLAIEIAPMPLA